MKKIIIISASIGKNLELAQKFEAQLNKLGLETSIMSIYELDLPLYHTPHESKYVAADLMKEHVGKLQDSLGYVFVTPEYNGGIPPLLTNFLAWTSRATKDWRSCFNGKPCAIGTFSGGGGMIALMALRMQLSYIGMNVMGRQIVTTISKPLVEDDLIAVCQGLKTLCCCKN